jgi:hypothetical protein
MSSVARTPPMTPIEKPCPKQHQLVRRIAAQDESRMMARAASGVPINLEDAEKTIARRNRHAPY